MDGTKFNELLEASIKEENGQQDKVGRSRIIQMAEQVGELNSTDPVYISAFNSVCGLIDNVGELQHSHIKNLLKFIEVASLNKKEIANKIKRVVFTKKAEEIDPMSRGELIRFVVENRDINVSASFINNQRDIYEADKWMWIDLMAFTNWELAFEKIILELENPNNQKSFAIRLPYYWEKLGQKIMLPSLQKVQKIEGSKGHNSLLLNMIEKTTGDAWEDASLIREASSPDANLESFFGQLSFSDNSTDCFEDPHSLH